MKPVVRAFEKTGTTVQFESEHELIFSQMAPGEFDKTILAEELGWSVVAIEELVKLSRVGQVNMLICGKNLSPRVSISFGVAKKFISVLRKKFVNKITFCCTPKNMHSIVASVRIMTGKPVEYFDTEEEARKWLIDRPTPRLPRKETFHPTGTIISYEPEHHLLFVRFTKTISVAEIQVESQWLLPLANQMLTESGEPTAILVSTKHLSPREKVSFRLFMDFIKVLRNPNFSKFAFFGEKKMVNALAGKIRILSRRRAKYFDTEEKARNWITGKIR